MKTLLLATVLSIFGKEPSGNGIHYRALTWSDFRRPAPADSLNIAALTTANLLFESEEDNGKFTFKVTALFQPDESFVRVKSDAVLRHEQTHFRIAYLMAMRCSRDLTALQHGDEAASEKANSLYDHYFQAMNDLNTQFDRETNHSLNKESEQLWETQIAAQINQLTEHGRNR